MSEIAELIDKLKREAKEGGELKHLPCPMCGLPRSRRSDYIRCTPCGTNWLNGENLSANPKIERYQRSTAEANRQLRSAGKKDTP